MSEYDDHTMPGSSEFSGRPSGRHPVNLTQLVMGVAFAGLLVVWALFEADIATGADLRWLLPIPWLSAGTVGLLATVLPSRSTKASA